MRWSMIVLICASGCSRGQAVERETRTARSEVPGRVQWWMKYGDSAPTEVEIGPEAGSVQVPTGVNDARCTYDAVQVDSGREVRWLRCVAPNWYASTIAACRAKRLLVTGPLADGDVTDVASQRDESMMLLRGVDSKQFGVGLRCVTTAK